MKFIEELLNTNWEKCVETMMSFLNPEKCRSPPWEMLQDLRVIPKISFFFPRLGRDLRLRNFVQTYQRSGWRKTFPAFLFIFFFFIFFMWIEENLNKIIETKVS